MDEQRAEAVRADLVGCLIEKRRLLLAVEVTTEEQADEILCWMYASDKPMKAELVSLAWDQQTIPEQVADALQALKDAIANSNY